MILVALAVAAGFQGERTAVVIAEGMSRLSPLTEPGLFGFSVAEWLGLALVGLISVYVLWRGFRR